MKKYNEILGRAMDIRNCNAGTLKKIYMILQEKVYRLIGGGIISLPFNKRRNFLLHNVLQCTIIDGVRLVMITKLIPKKLLIGHYSYSENDGRFTMTHMSGSDNAKLVLSRRRQRITCTGNIFLINDPEEKVCEARILSECVNPYTNYGVELLLNNGGKLIIINHLKNKTGYLPYKNIPRYTFSIMLFDENGDLEKVIKQ